MFSCWFFSFQLFLHYAIDNTVFFILDLEEHLRHFNFNLKIETRNLDK